LKEIVEEITSYELKNSWKNKPKGWGHSLHKLCSRTGCFSPAFARYFVWKYSKPLDKILDPFSGKGTVPLESCVTGRVGIGNDIAPEAYILTQAKVRPLPLKKVKSYLVFLKNKISNIDVSITEADQVSVYFHKDTFKQILALKEFLIDRNSDEDIFIKALMCGIIHGSSNVSLSVPCSHSFSMSPEYVKKYANRHGLIRPKRDIIECLEKKAENVLSDPLPKIKGKAYCEDARKLPLNDESIDLIITSPPYFDRQTYAWDNWLRLWFLGYDYREVRKKLIQTSSISKYTIFMKDCIAEMYRVLKNNSVCVIVVGDVNLRGKKIKTAELLVEPAEAVGFSVNRIIVDKINQKRKHFGYLKKTQGIKTERILELYKGTPRVRNRRVNWEVQYQMPTLMRFFASLKISNMLKGGFSLKNFGL